MRLFSPFLAVLLLAGVVGCGGGSTPSFDDPSGGGGGTTARAPAGDYSASLSGSDDAGVGYSGIGTAKVASDGTITLNYSSVTDESTPVTTSRKVVAAVSVTGDVSGTLTIDSTTVRTITGGLTKSSNGAYRLTVVSGAPVTETDTFTLTLSQPASGIFSGSVSGSDTQGGTYSGSGTLTLSGTGSFNLAYTSNRLKSGVTQVEARTIASTLQSDGTFSGSMVVQSGGISRSVTGTWSASGNSLVLNLNYANGTAVPPYTATEKLTLTRE